MHISIPDTEELTETKGSRSGQPLRFLVYNIHINGTYHCSARYSVLAKLHERLKREFGAGCLETFPGKSFFYMKPDQAHHRRWMLQRWIQKISQQPRIVQGETFQTFLLNAQKEVQKGPEEDVSLEVFLVNGKSVKVDITSTDQTEDVLETVCAVIGLTSDLTYFFSLYLVKDVTGKEVIRSLQDFESPFISLKRAKEQEDHYIMLKKAYWDMSLDAQLYRDPIALNLLYIQAISDIKNNLIDVDDPEISAKLDAFRAAKDRQAFMRLARSLPGYGFALFGDCSSNHPDENEETKMQCRLGRGELVLTEKATNKEHHFLVQRMRCWRTYTTEEGVEMEFEYYFDPDMTWVRILADNTIHLAMCLQSMVEEMLRLRDGKEIKKPSDRVGKFKPRRQTNKPADLTFLTSDTSASATPTTEDAPVSPTKKPPSVTLSDLLGRVKTKEESDDDEELDFEQIMRPAISEEQLDGPTNGTTATNGTTHHDDDDDDDDYFSSVFSYYRYLDSPIKRSKCLYDDDDDDIDRRFLYFDKPTKCLYDDNDDDDDDDAGDEQLVWHRTDKATPKKLDEPSHRVLDDVYRKWCKANKPKKTLQALIRNIPFQINFATSQMWKSKDPSKIFQIKRLPPN
eukprot:m.165711 g.165711  ORF g.165711 m.165711 type:complete len:626 (-) comp24983_c0_seq3:45-1922(-)